MKLCYLTMVGCFFVTSAGASELLDVRTSVASAHVGDSVLVVSKRNEDTDYMQRVWLNDFGNVVGHGPFLHITSEIAEQASEIKVCEKQTLRNGQSLTGCSKAVIIGGRDYGDNLASSRSVRDLKPTVTNITFDGFPAIGETVHVNYTFDDPDDGDIEVDTALVLWEYAKKSAPSDFSLIPGEISQDLTIPTAAGSETLEAGDLIRAILSVTSSGIGEPTSEPAYSEPVVLYENYPGGNITENKYYRPLFVSETSYSEGTDNTYTVDENGTPISSGPGYDLAILPQNIAIEECGNLGLKLVSDAADFVGVMNDSVDTEKWPQHKPYWTTGIDADDPWLHPYSVAYNDNEGSFVMSASNPVARGFVVCEKE